ncbi:hypothetical protein HU200_042978 [Digitaria exilis]|uniref:BTB domain-containing protein n=1 Tax=Digitaria exilis TaxID=1010633 RepID=A0A835B6I2_9POAL|nr:hypothetical protein HU200_042978 [Digitaria exilis]
MHLLPHHPCLLSSTSVSPSPIVAMEPAGCVDLTGAVSSVRLLKINGYNATSTMTKLEYIKYSWKVDGHDWEVHCYPQRHELYGLCAKLKLIFLGKAHAQPHKVTATLTCRPVDPSPTRTKLSPFDDRRSVSASFCHAQDSSPPLLLVVRRNGMNTCDYLQNDSLTIHCTISVLTLKERLSDGVVFIPAPAKEGKPLPVVPPSDLHHHLGELFLSDKGADVTFVVGGESFPAHKILLAARSPVFMAEFFGHMKESHSRRVEVEGMEADVFRGMLRFIYTDDVAAAELDVSSMAEHLLAAADRYGLERLKVICERKLAGGIGVDTAAATLALAEQHGCSVLKARCVEFIVGSPGRLDAVLSTEGYKHLAASCPLVLAELSQGCSWKKELRSILNAPRFAAPFLSASTTSFFVLCDYNGLVARSGSLVSGHRHHDGGLLGRLEVPPVTAELSRGQAKDLFVMSRSELPHMHNA